MDQANLAQAFRQETQVHAFTPVHAERGHLLRFPVTHCASTGGYDLSFRTIFVDGLTGTSRQIIISPTMPPRSEVPTKDLTIVITSAELKAEDNTWQQECRQLYGQIHRALDTGELKPSIQQAGSGDRAGILEFFNQFVATGITTGGFGAIFELAKLWGEHRKNCEVTLILPGGAQLKVSKVSYDEAVQLWEEHSARFGMRRSR